MEHSIFTLPVHCGEAGIGRAQLGDLPILLAAAYRHTARSPGVPSLLQQSVVELAGRAQHPDERPLLRTGWKESHFMQPPQPTRESRRSHCLILVLQCASWVAERIRRPYRRQICIRWLHGPARDRTSGTSAHLLTSCRNRRRCLLARRAGKASEASIPTFTFSFTREVCTSQGPCHGEPNTALRPSRGAPA